MSKSVYIFVFMILVYHGWNLSFLPDISSDYYLIIELIYLFWGYKKWKSDTISVNLFTDLIPFWLILLGIAGSMVMAEVFYGQALLTSIITYRTHLLWFVLPVFIRIAPTEEDIIKAFMYFVFALFGIYMIKRTMPTMLRMDEEEMMRMISTGEYIVNGLVYLTIPLYYYFSKIIKDGYKKKYIFWCLSAFLLLFFMQNRSNLFAAIIVMTLAVFWSNSQKKASIFFGFILAVILFFYNAQDTLTALLEETTSNIDDTDYNRNMAINYFLTQANPSWLTMIFGNGVLSAHTSSIIEDLQLIGIFNSDVGFIGFWNQYGIIPVFVFIYISLVAILGKKIPNYVRMMAGSVLLCAGTTSYYGKMGHAIYFILLYYLVIYYKTNAKRNNMD